MLQEFVRMASIIFLNILEKDAKEQVKLFIERPVSIPSIVIFLDKFVEYSPYISRDFLEKLMPYTLLRSMFKEVYETKKTKKKDGVPDDAI
eukprot:TRINITY_DN3628_c1_g1_i2.p1 TRINITY_DN3628_c1_g1~~TRINITY_DN3628_c1_g1_i2.p1  ORF type:complete len:100 (+),score=13.98 TRINITY_DN3628_c1_g1_i2:30-302(+)